MTRIVFLDTETTNLDTDLAEPWEIAAIVRRTTARPGEQLTGAYVDEEYVWQLWPDLRTADPNSLRISRFYQRIQASQTAMTDGTDAVTTHTPDGADFTGPTDSITVAGDLAHYLNGAVIIGSNPDYDVRILTRWLRSWGQAYVGHYRPIDVVTYAAGYLSGVRPGWAPLTPPWTSADMTAAMGLEDDAYDKHTALGDARWARDLWDAVNFKASPFIPLSELVGQVEATHAAGGVPISDMVETVTAPRDGINYEGNWPQTVRTTNPAVDATYDAGAGEWIPFGHAFDGHLPFGSCQRWIHTAATHCGHKLDDRGIHPAELNPGHWYIDEEGNNQRVEL